MKASHVKVVGGVGSTTVHFTYNLNGQDIFMESNIASLNRSQPVAYCPDIEMSFENIDSETAEELLRELGVVTEPKYEPSF